MAEVTALIELVVSEPTRFDNPEWAKFPMSSVDGCVMIAERNLRAYCFIEVSGLNSVYIHSLEVHPQWRRRGFGHAIIEKLFSLYPQHDFLLHSHYDDAAQGFWAKHGFRMISGYFTGGVGTSGLVRTDKDIKEFYVGNDPLTLAYLGAVWSPEARRFISVSERSGATNHPILSGVGLPIYCPFTQKAQ